MSAPILTVKQLAAALQIPLMTYRRNFLARNDHPKPIFKDTIPARYRLEEVCAWLQISLPRGEQ